MKVSGFRTDALRAGTRREVLLGGLMVASAGAAALLRPRRLEQRLGKAHLEDLVPRSIGRWQYQASSGLVLPPADQLRDQIYSQLLTRSYTRADGAGVMLLIAYNGRQGGVIQVHRPEVCYPASGYRLSIVKPHIAQLQSGLDIPSRYIKADAGMRSEQLIYWTRLGSHFPTTWSDQRIAVVEENLHGIIPDGALVRMSTLIPGDARPLLDEFAADLYRSVGARMRDVLVGSG